jgi:hypothetical protein
MEEWRNIQHRKLFRESWIGVGLPRYSLCSPRCARYGLVDWLETQGSPRGLGQPWAKLFDPVGVVIMARGGMERGVDADARSELIRRGES